MLSGLLWIFGLVDSLQRPSVGNSLELRQQELTALAAPALPAGLRQALTGAQPLEALRLDLQKQVDEDPVPPAAQQQLQLALLERQAGQGAAARQRLGELNQQVPPEQRLLLRALMEPASGADPAELELATLEPLLKGWGLSPLSRQLICQALGGPLAACENRPAQQAAVLRLLGTTMVPVLLLLLGSALLLRELWLRWRGKAAPQAPLVGPPLTLAEVTLLIAGGFVVLGELVMPLLLAPLLQGLLKPLASQPALQQGLLVLGLYSGLMAAPLVLLWSQLRPHAPRPQGAGCSGTGDPWPAGYAGLLCRYCWCCPWWP